MEDKWYKTFFEKYYFPFLAERKTFSDTKEEASFIMSTLPLKRGKRVLDLACGAGRHTIELAKNGYSVVGIDLNKDCLTDAEQKAKDEKMPIDFICSDMRQIPFSEEFDAAISMFSSFGYLETEEDDDKVLKEIFKSLKKEGFLLLDLQNKNWMLKNVPAKTWDENDDGSFLLEKRKYNAENKTYNNEITIIYHDGKIEKTSSSVRLYEFDEIQKKIEIVGFKIVEVFGGYDKSKFDEQESKRMIILAKKD